VRNLSLTTVGAFCAILAVVAFVAGVVLMGTAGVQTLIPETGSEGLEWIADVDEAGGGFYVGAWLIVLVTLLGVVAMLGFYEALRGAGAFMIIAPVVAIVGLSVVTLSHLIPIALAYELVPAYMEADAAATSTLAATNDTFARSSLLMNYVGNALSWAVAVPLFAYAILKTRALPRWIGWLGFFVAAVAGWLGLLAPASSVIEGIAFVGFVAFFVFTLSMGIALLRRRPVQA
jgi:hypothetical protein